MVYLLGVREARQKSEIRTACWNIPGLSLIHLGLVMSRWFWPLGVFWPGRWGLLPARVMITAGSSEEREVVVSLSHVQLFVTPWTAARQASLTFTISRSLLKLMSIKLVMPSNRLILCLPLLLLPSILPSIEVFSNKLALHIRWPTYWSFSFSISPSNEYSGLISFRVDWFLSQSQRRAMPKTVQTTVQLNPIHMLVR